MRDNIKSVCKYPKQYTPSEHKREVIHYYLSRTEENVNVGAVGRGRPKIRFLAIHLNFCQSNKMCCFGLAPKLTGQTWLLGH